MSYICIDIYTHVSVHIYLYVQFVYEKKTLNAGSHFFTPLE